MKTMNRIFLIGHLGGDPELRQSEGGVPFAQLSMATNRLRPKDSEGSGGNGSKPYEVDWHNVYVWGLQGERCAEWLKKGSLVFVEGELRHLESQGENGETRRRSVVHAKEVKFLNSKNGILDNRAAPRNYDAVAHP